MEAILVRILRPIARFAIAHGLSFGQAQEALKRAYLAAAQDASEQERATDSRLSLLTGLQRRDIVRLRDQRDPDQTVVSPLTRVLHLWYADNFYGCGAPLPRRGSGASFDTLARAVRKDVHPRTLFDQLIETGAIAYDESLDLVRPLSRSYQPEAGSPEQLDFLARHLSDHAAAAVSNVLSDAPTFFDRSLHISKLSPEAISDLDTRFRDAEMQIFSELADRGEALKASSPGNGRFRAGGYSYWEENAS
ncbi:MAG: DUF6502 family protein [Pseudomonadota bacterium]